MHFACLYIPMFPAWVFERVDAAAQAAPVVVAAAGEVVAFSRKLRGAGVVEGISVERARQLLPEGVVFRQRDAQLEQAAWEDVLHEINAFTPFIEPDGAPGRVFFKPFAMEDVRGLASKLHAQVALAPHRTTAMLAAMRTASGNVVSVRREHVDGFLDRFEIGRLAELRGPTFAWLREAQPGHALAVPAGAPVFSEEILEQLPLFGFDTLGAARMLAHRHLKAQFGADGERLYRLLHPQQEEEPASLYQPPPAIRRAYEFDVPCSEPGEILPALEFILKQAVAELGGNGAQRVKVTLHDRLRPTSFSCRVLPEPSSDPRRLFGTIRTLLKGLLDAAGRVQAVELELGSLRSTRPEQRSLFFQRPAAAKAVEAVHRRYPDAIRRPVTQPDAVFDEERSRMETYEVGRKS